MHRCLTGGTGLPFGPDVLRRSFARDERPLLSLCLCPPSLFCVACSGSLDSRLLCDSFRLESWELKKGPRTSCDLPIFTSEESASVRVILSVLSFHPLSEEQASVLHLARLSSPRTPFLPGSTCIVGDTPVPGGPCHRAMSLPSRLTCSLGETAGEKHVSNKFSKES